MNKFKRYKTGVEEMMTLIVEDFLLKYHESKACNKRDLSRNWSREIIADYFGLQLCLETLHDEFEQKLSCSAAELFFAALCMAQLFCQKKYVEGRPYQKHPPMEVRLHFLIQGARKLDPSLLEGLLIGDFKQVADYILRRLLTL